MSHSSTMSTFVPSPLIAKYSHSPCLPMILDFLTKIVSFIKEWNIAGVHFNLHLTQVYTSLGAGPRGLQGTRHCGFCRFSMADQDLLFLSLSQTDQRFAKLSQLWVREKRCVLLRASTDRADSVASALRPENLGSWAASSTQGYNQGCAFCIAIYHKYNISHHLEISQFCWAGPPAQGFQQEPFAPEETRPVQSCTNMFPCCH